MAYRGRRGYGEQNPRSSWGPGGVGKGESPRNPPVLPPRGLCSFPFPMDTQAPCTCPLISGGSRNVPSFQVAGLAAPVQPGGTPQGPPQTHPFRAWPPSSHLERVFRLFSSSPRSCLRQRLEGRCQRTLASGFDLTSPRLSGRFCPKSCLTASELALRPNGWTRETEDGWSCFWAMPRAVQWEHSHHDLRMGAYCLEDLQHIGWLYRVGGRVQVVAPVL
jgi:hypothetical protein